MWLVGVEYLALWWQDARLPVLHDNILSLAHATFYEVTKFLVRGFEYWVYVLVWQKWAILPPLGDSPLAALALVVLTDFCYYWLHRASHEIMVLWAVHQVHHTSQDLTVAVGLRHSPLQRLFLWVFYLPMAVLGVPPAHMLAHAQFNLVFQCWIHTEAIRTLGPCEYIFNTPSHHRVHHGVNQFCLDKNYAGLFIVWDRLFGTYQDELPDQEIIYGIITQPESCNLIYHQIFYLKLAVGKANSMDTWDKWLCSLVKGPSWVPGSPWTGWDENKPDIRASREYQKVRATAATHCYVLLHFLAALSLITRLTTTVVSTPVEVFVYSLAVVATLTCIGVLYDGLSCCRLVEMVRCGIGLALCLLLPLQAITGAELRLLTTLYTLSFILWLVRPNTIINHKVCKD
ncbi:alkylglycerol monooxygenase-like isoform X2 [Homarus americanus]|nr:alkylglycerol monooxygenase-like isoform X2 [Homarus americanus]XP_042229781.1 alkylglycerol monooxygenase-like isoform X2 [Homarus americanus]